MGTTALFVEILIRDPRWFTLDDARAQLGAGGREPRYAREHARVVAATARRLARS